MPKSKSKYQPKVTVGENLDSILEEEPGHEEESDEKNQAEEEQGLDESVDLDVEKLRRALENYIIQLKAERQMTLATVLQNSLEKLEVDYNRLTIVVGPGLDTVVQKSDDLVPYLRDKIQETRLVLDIKIDEEFSFDSENIPYTDEEKLRELERQNPIIEKLQKIFNTRILY